MPQYSITLLAIAVPILVVGYLAYRRHRSSNAWSTFADRHDFSFGPPGWFGDLEMGGEYRGESVRVHTFRRGTGRNNNTYTAFAVTLPASVPMDLVLYDESLFSKLGKLFGGEDLQIGRPDLDDAFIIRGGHAHEIREFLDRDVVADALLDLYDFCSDLHVEHQSLHLERRGLVHDEETIEEYLEAIVRCAKVLKNAGEANAIGTMETYESESAHLPDHPEDADGDFVSEW